MNNKEKRFAGWLVFAGLTGTALNEAFVDHDLASFIGFEFVAILLLFLAYKKS